MRRVLVLLGAVALVAVVVIGLGQAGRDGEAETPAQSFDLEQAKQELAGAPAPLAALHEQSNAILEDGFDERLSELEGHPVVINKWASWCRPCRAEFPIFQQVATSAARRSPSSASTPPTSGRRRRSSSTERPLPYPSYEDPDEDIARELEAAKFFPMTIFVDEKGDTAFVKAGEYTSAAELEADIDKYLGGT